MGMTSTLAEMSQDVLDRLQDPTGVFWSRQNEIYAGLAEAISELLLIIGRPTQQFNTNVTLAPNTVWQKMPANMLAITNILCNGSLLWKTTLHSLDYLQSSWSSQWESDRGPYPLRWAPLGLRYFIVHPAPVEPVQVTVAGVCFPVAGTWPYSGAQTSLWHKELNDALELYAASYARIKILGEDFQEGLNLYRQFQVIAQRLTTLEDRRDSLVSTRSFGVPTAPSQTSSR